ncbi:unnamed protein product, partial [marine sediment metagenome]
MKSKVKDLDEEFKENIKSFNFFDSNCWIGKPNNPGPFYLSKVDEIKEYMKYCGIEKALVSHTLARFFHPKVGNELLLREIEGHKGLIGCFILLPPSTRELGPINNYIEDMLKRGVKAVRLFPNSHNYSLKEYSCGDLFAKLEERRIPVFIWSRETDWNTLYELCTNHPKLPVVLEQCDEEAYWNLRYQFPLFEKCENMFVETNKGHLYLGIDEIVSRFGADRIIFGTHMPVDDPHASMMLITDGEFS